MKIGGEELILLILKPSPSYCYVLLPLCLVGTVVIFILGRRSRTKAGETKSVVRETVSLLVRLLCGVVLFLLLPIAYASFHSIYEGLSTPRSDFPLWVWPPLIATGKIFWGLVLLAAWLFLQPETLWAISPEIRRKGRLLTWPMLLFLTIFSLWFIVAVFRPIFAIPGKLA